MRLHGEWSAALAEAQRAARRDVQRDARSTATAFYELAELHRLRGDFREAEDAYRDASRYGLEPQPGLALLRLGQGRPRIAAAAIRRVAGTTQAPLERVKVLPACVEIMLGTGELAAAHAAADELERIAVRFDTELIAASAAHARGNVELADGEAYAALASLRRALGLWQELRAPYQAAKARVSLALSCRLLGDEDGAALELDVGASGVRAPRSGAGSRARRCPARASAGRAFLDDDGGARTHAARTRSAAARRDGPHEPADRGRARRSARRPSTAT